jgi:hypothetical protein
VSRLLQTGGQFARGALPPQVPRASSSGVRPLQLDNQTPTLPVQWETRNLALLLKLKYQIAFALVAIVSSISFASRTGWMKRHAPRPVTVPLSDSIAKPPERGSYSRFASGIRLVEEPVFWCWSTQEQEAQNCRELTQLRDPRVSLINCYYPILDNAAIASVY